VIARHRPHIGFGEYWSIVFGETVGRSGSAMEGHWGPPGYHLVLLVPLFWPGVLLTSISLARAAVGAHAVPEQIAPVRTNLTMRMTTRWRGPPASSACCALAFLRGILARPGPARRAVLPRWIAPSWIVFELVATKLPHYTLPLYPPIALLTARGCCRRRRACCRRPGRTRRRLGHKVWLGVGAVVVVALPVGASVFGGPALIPAGVVVAVVSAECVRRAWRRLGMGQFGVAQAWSVGAAVVALAGTLGVVLPNADGVWLSPELAEIIAEHDDGERARRRGGLPRGQPDLPDPGAARAHRRRRGMAPRESRRES
jgi:4-amino-4-deoxy-L-arabinose transferase-like glycosyltransferase